MSKTNQKIRRCAVYTRKSSEEGLEQAFNSLDAQREACEAYSKSQAHEGWQVIPEHYDDGGFSGGNMLRPALSRLLEEIDQGQVDIVIVYKVDRLSRSLADFVRLIELFDQTGVSFVSVTQAFNTSTSRGRLTLNVLLSFAQFEREVTSERIRDKIAASKKKGMWMGGLVPLGYDRVEKQLVVSEQEAKTVRHIYTRYLALGCVRAPERQVCVMDFQVISADDEFDHLAEAIPEFLTAELTRTSRMRLRDPQDLARYLTGLERGWSMWDHPRLKRIGEALGTDYLVLGSVTRLGENFVIESRLFSVPKGHVVPGTAFRETCASEHVQLHPGARPVRPVRSPRLARCRWRI